MTGRLSSIGAADGRAGAALRKRSVTVAGHRTSVSLEAAFWDALKEIARRRGCPLSLLIQEVDARRAEELAAAPNGAAPSSASRKAGRLPRAPNLSSALRVFVLEELRAMAPSSANS